MPKLISLFTPISSALPLLVCGLLAACAYSMSCGPEYLHVLYILVADLYLGFAIFIAALRSDGCSEQLSGLLPTKTAGLFIVVLILVILVFSFGNLYCIHPDSPVKNELWESRYFSLLTITTVGYPTSTPQTAAFNEIIVYQLISGMLLVFGAFPLLISRLSQFSSDD